MADHGHAGTFQIPDAHLLFSGDFQRSGGDLIISDQLHRVIVPNYFHGDKRPLLVSPEGAPLGPNVIDALTGHIHYAQAAGTNAAGKVVGQVVKMTGSASLVRNGVTIVLNNGDAVYQTDVVQTGSGSTLGLVLIDGTTFNLTANARLMLNDLTYDATSTSNTSLFTLVQGAVNFIAGQVAKTGDMKVETAVAVIGIRGTAVILDIDSTDGKVSISVVDQQDNQVHSVQVFKCVPTSTQGVCSSGDLIGTVSSNGSSLSLTPSAALQVIAQETSKTPAQITQEFGVFQQVLSTYDAGKQLAPNTPPPSDGKRGDATPQSTTKFAGSSTPPIELTGAQLIPASTDSAEHPNTSTETVIAVTALSSGIVNPTQLPNSQPQIPTIQGLPTTVAITTPVAIGNIINQSEVSTGFIISGTATAGAAPVNGQTVTIAIVDSSNIAKYTYTTTVTNGAWSVSVTAAQAQALADGSYNIQATVSDASGNAATTVTQTIMVDTVPPTVTISTPDTTTNQPTQTISGHVTTTEAAAGATVKLYDSVSGVTTQIGTATVGSGGTWSTSVTLSGSGSHSITVQDTDAAGNTGTSNSVVFTVGAAAPTVVAVTDNVAAAVTNGPISFTATFSEAVTGVSTSSFTATNGTVASVTQVDSSHYTIVVNPTAGLVSGNVALSLVAGGATDTAGNVAVAANLSSLDSQGINTLAPTVVAVTDNVAAAVTNGPISFTATFSEAVTGVSTSSFTATNGTVASVTQVDSSHYTIVVNPTAGLVSGNVALSLVAGGATDTAGNVAVAENLSSLDSQGINTLAPTVVAVTDNVAAAVTNGLISFTATFSEAVTGVSTSSFTATNGTVASVTQVDSSHYTIVVNPTAGLASGNVALSLVAGGATDTAGNVAVAANLSSLDSQGIDTATPTGGTPALTTPSDSGTSHTDNITDVTNPTFTVALNPTVAVGDTVQLLLGGSALAHPVSHTITSPDIANGFVSLTVTAGDLGGDGSKSITAQFTDAASNTSTTAADVITLDTLPPTVTISTTGTTTNQATQTISGAVTTTEAAAGATVTLFDTVNNVTTQIGTATVSGGAWSTSVLLSGNGNHSITAQDTDAAGNIGTSAPVIFTLATVAPTIAITTPVAGDNIINKAEAAAGVSVSGTATAGSGVRRSMARPRRSRWSTARTSSRTPIRRR